MCGGFSIFKALVLLIRRPISSQYALAELLMALLRGAFVTSACLVVCVGAWAYCVLEQGYQFRGF